MYDKYDPGWLHTRALDLLLTRRLRARQMCPFKERHYDGLDFLHDFNGMREEGSFVPCCPADRWFRCGRAVKQCGSGMCMLTTQHVAMMDLSAQRALYTKLASLKSAS